MPRTEYSKEERSHALALYREHGPREAGRLTGIPVRTISRWATEDGVSTEVVTKTQAATEAAKVSREARREHLRELLLERAIETVEEIGGRYEFVTKDGDTVTLARVPASAKKDLATTAGILIEKFRLEAGEHTSRPDLSSFDVAAAGLAKLAEQS